jgi:pimeloyl-ACP methyl ester carboxylesterase
MKRPHAPPSLLLTALELRAFGELALYFAFQPWLKPKRYGDGHPVLVLPGLAAGDASTRPLRAFLRGCGFRAHGWGIGVNRGTDDLAEQVRKRLDALYNRYRRPVSLVGWSMGGIFARELAKAEPNKVRFVITLGTPFTGHPRATWAVPLYEYWTRNTVQDDESWRSLGVPPPVPTTSIFSRSDGIVHWRLCLNAQTAMSENIRIEASHLGIGHHPATLLLIADRLSQPHDRWRPFQPRGWKRLLYRPHVCAPLPG